MMKVLHITASPRGWQSSSIAVAKEFLRAFLQGNPGAGVEEFDLHSADIPEFGTPAASAKYAVMAGQTPTDQDMQTWRKVIDVIEEFKSADMLVLSSPMWNFGIPYRLKQYFDIIVQPGLTFTYDAKEGYKGLVTDRPAVLVLSRGGKYPTGTQDAFLDMQKPYLELILKFIGFTDISTVVAEPMLAEGEEVAQAAIREAMEVARSLAGEIAFRTTHQRATG